MEKGEEQQKDKREKSVAASSVAGLEWRGETHKRLRLHFVSPPSEGGASIFSGVACVDGTAAEGGTGERHEN